MKMSKDINEIRQKIEEIDEKIIQLLSARLELIPDLVSIKKSRGIPIFQPEREVELFEKLDQLAQEYGLDPEFIHDVFARIITEMKDLQRIESINKARENTPK